MTEYRGRHSRSDADISSEPSRRTTSRPPRHAANPGATSEQPPARRAHARTEGASVPSAHRRGREKTTRHTAPSLSATGRFKKATQRKAASPHAFKHHDAVHETGARHSRVKTLLVVIPLVLALVIAGVVGFFLISPLLQEEAPIEAGIPVSVTIPEGAATDQIAAILKESQVIADTKTFIASVRARNAEQSLKPGTYELTTLMDSTMLIDMLVAGPAGNSNSLTIPEGLTVEQTAQIVENVCGIPQADFLARAYAASEYASEYPFVQDAYNNSLEGFLYPKTYNIPVGSNADYVIRVLLDQFALETSNLDLAYAQEHGMNLFHVITLASLIEKETAAEEERPRIASVIYNRLHDGWKLQIDATVVYALGPSYDGHALLYEDLEVDSPYNTYLINELPAGPICSPSISSIEAAAHPEETNFYYYVLTSVEGSHTFCETEEEFEAAKDVYMSVFGIEP